MPRSPGGAPLAAAVIVALGAIFAFVAPPPEAAAQQIGSRVSLQSVNYPDHYIRHQNYRGRISRVASPLDRRDSTFVLRAGLAGQGVSFESVNFPGHYLRHRNFEIWLDRFDGSDLFRKDASFLPEAGLAGTGTSFRSVNYPDRYLRHENSLLFLHGRTETALYRADASFRVAAAAASGLYRSRWDKIGGAGGPWSTGWVPDQTAPVCRHSAPGCSCFGTTYCGIYRDGDTTFWWPQGCSGPRWTIRCTSRPQ